MNVIGLLPQMIKDVAGADSYINFGLLFNLDFFMRNGIVRIFYFAFAIFLVIVDIRQGYFIRVSFGDKDINKGTHGTSRWTTLQEVDRQYKKIELYPSKDREFKTIEDAESYVAAHKGSYITKADEDGGTYIVRTPNFYKGKGGIPVLRWKDKLYIDPQLTNNLFLGTTRSGKGEMFVFPLIDIMSRAEDIKNRPSMIIFDPKIELYKASKETLEKRGYHIRLLNLDNPMKSAGYNPLAIIARYYSEGKFDEAQQLAKSFSFSIFNSSNDTQEPIWKNTSTDLFTALIIAVVSDCVKADEVLNTNRRNSFIALQSQWDFLDDKEEAMRVYKEQLASLPEGYDYLSDVTDPVKAIPSDLEYEPIYPNSESINCFSVINFFKELCDVTSETANMDDQAGMKQAETALDDYFNLRPELDYAKSLYASIKSAGDRTKGSIYVNMQSALTIFALDSIARMTAVNDIDFKEIGFGDKPVAVFLGLPTEDKSNHFLALNFVTQVFQYLFKLAKADKGTLKRNVRFILDEFGNMPVLNNFGGMVTNCLGVGFSFDIFIQSYNQLHTNYEMEVDTIKDNFANQFYILANGDESAQEFSTLLGTKTVVEVQRTGSRFETNKSISENATERALLKPDELQTFREGEAALIRSSHRTARSGAAIKSYPILAEYIEKLNFFERRKVASKVRLDRANGNILINRETGEDLTAREQVEYEDSQLRRKKGTAFLFRYQYATSDFPNPTEISLDEICDETRANINYNEMVYDTGKVRERIRNELNERARHSRQMSMEMQVNSRLMRYNMDNGTSFTLEDYNRDINQYKFLSGFATVNNILAEEIGNDYLSELRIGPETNPTDVLKAISNWQNINKNERIDRDMQLIISILQGR